MVNSPDAFYLGFEERDASGLHWRLWRLAKHDRAKDRTQPTGAASDRLRILENLAIIEKIRMSLMVTITAAELQNRFGRYRDLAQREAVSVTHHGRESIVVLSADEYKRLKALDTRRAFYVHELPDDIIAKLEKGYQGEATPHLDHLMK
jgi:prevent-host-death family protein